MLMCFLILLFKLCFSVLSCEIIMACEKRNTRLQSKLRNDSEDESSVLAPPCNELTNVQSSNLVIVHREMERAANNGVDSETISEQGSIIDRSVGNRSPQESGMTGHILANTVDSGFASSPFSQISQDTFSVFQTANIVGSNTLPISTKEHVSDTSALLLQLMQQMGQKLQKLDTMEQNQRQTQQKLQKLDTMEQNLRKLDTTLEQTREDLTTELHNIESKCQKICNDVKTQVCEHFQPIFSRHENALQNHEAAIKELQTVFRENHDTLQAKMDSVASTDSVMQLARTQENLKDTVDSISTQMDTLKLGSEKHTEEMCSLSEKVAELSDQFTNLSTKVDDNLNDTKPVVFNDTEECKQIRKFKQSLNQISTQHQREIREVQDQLTQVIQRLRISEDTRAPIREEGHRNTEQPQNNNTGHFGNYERNWQGTPNFEMEPLKRRNNDRHATRRHDDFDHKLFITTRKFKTFKNSGNDIHPQAWLHQFSHCFPPNWSLEHRLEFMCGYLENEPAVRMRSVIHDCHSEGEFYHAFLSAYWSQATQDRVKHSIMMMKHFEQSEFSSLVKYFEDMLHKNQYLSNPYSPSELIRICIMKFPEHLRNIILAGRCKDDIEAFQGGNRQPFPIFNLRTGARDYCHRDAGRAGSNWLPLTAAITQLSGTGRRRVVCAIVWHCARGRSAPPRFRGCLSPPPNSTPAPTRATVWLAVGLFGNLSRPRHSPADGNRSYFRFSTPPPPSLLSGGR
ncbi:uncharacterized protein LOC126282375 [Schistocerca gregaria]|uniref:uncharacterized protein LOC126282375 n=1 Tax=Schistocerca gregaria TaxID=7010 RepID=UPI00211DDE44|nr:uncharacterized protein LOC126282375 [Schistocerca gregaria]